MEPLHPDPTPGLFPAPATRRRRLPSGRAVAGGAVAVALLIGGVAVAVSGSSTDTEYRTAAVGSHSVDQILDAVATIEPVDQASVAFPVTGTVSQVDVEVGDTVVVGQPLATLDTEALTRTLHERQAALAQANLLLQKALDGEDVSQMRGTGSASTGTATGVSWDTTGSTTATVRTVSLARTDPSTTNTSTNTSTTSATLAPAAGTPSSGAGAGGSTDHELRAAQQAVLDAQGEVDTDLAAAELALESATQVCAAVGQDGAAAAVIDDTTSTTVATSTGAGITACRDALQAVLDAQGLVAQDQTALAGVSSTLDDLLTARAAAGVDSGSGSTGIGAAGSGTGGGGSTPASSSPTTSGSDTKGTSPSAAQLVAYQKGVDAAEANVAVADQAIDQAAIVSPIAGTVAAVGLSAGDEVSSGSSTATVVVVGKGGFEVSTTVSVDDVPDLEVGQAATVVPDGTDTILTGEVVRIGAAQSTSGLSTTYPVTIGLTGDTTALGNGATASVSIVTDAAARALSVPTSAVTVAGTRHTVTVVDGSATKTVTVEVGAIGSTWTEVTSGLDVGQQVVLADLGKPLPGSATDTPRTDAGRSAFPGGGTGGPPAGFRPGG